MKYLSLCSGIEAATVAWEPLGFEPVAFSEIEPFPSAVLAHHYPHVPNWGDMTKYKEWPDANVDVLVGGTPCQSFSVAGLRKGLDDPRGNLMLTFGAIADKYRPSWLVWENVPGVLSSNGGRDFGTFLGMLGQLGYGFAYRVLDAQYVRTQRHSRAVPQRRRRVFVAGYLGDWRRAAAILFERESLSGNSPPSRKAGQAVTAVTGKLSANGGGTARPGGNCNELDFCVTQPYEVGNCLSARMHKGINTTLDECQTPVIAFEANMSQQQPSVDNVAQTITRRTHASVTTSGFSVRRLLPVECERLQGFPDGYTQIPWNGKPAENCPDGPRYKALGNSMATNVMEWIGQRIKVIEGIINGR